MVLQFGLAASLSYGQSRCSAYLWLAAPLLLSGYFAIFALAASAAGVPWSFSLALQPHSTRAIALLSLWLAAPEDAAKPEDAARNSFERAYFTVWNFPGVVPGF